MQNPTDLALGAQAMFNPRIELDDVPALDGGCLAVDADRGLTL